MTPRHPLSATPCSKTSFHASGGATDPEKAQKGSKTRHHALFYLHHTRMITKAAVVRDATMIREQVQSLRQRVCTAHAGAGGVP